MSVFRQNFRSERKISAASFRKWFVRLFFRLLPLGLLLLVAVLIRLAWIEPQRAISNAPPPGEPAPTTPESARPPEAETESRAPKPSSIPPAALTPESAQLVQRYDAALDVTTKINILHDLAENPDSRSAYLALFPRESEAPLKAVMVNLAEGRGELDDALFALLDLAMVPAEDDEVRFAAERILALEADPRTIPIWQKLLSDSNPAFRELAANQIETLSALSPEMAKPQ